MSRRTRAGAGRPGASPGSPREAEADERRLALVVLGMHRSGTSAMARLLSLCGADLPRTLMEAGDQNPRGYFESAVLFELHERLLADAGGSWDDLTPLPPGWVESAHGRRWAERLARAVEDEVGDSPLFVIKDPRICRLVPVWRRALADLETEPRFVLTLRNPLEVAASLRRAQGTPEVQGWLLTLQHMLAAERDTRDAPRCFVRYDSLLRDWRTDLERLSRELAVDLPRLGRRAEAEIDAFLEETLRHHHSQDAELARRRDVPGWVVRAHEWMGRAALGKPVDPAELDALAAELAPAEAAFGPLVASLELGRRQEHERSNRLERQVERMEAEADHARQERAEAIRSSEALREELAERDRDLERLTEWVKVLLRWASEILHGGEETPSNLAVTLEALDAATPAERTRIATAGIRMAQQSAEVVRLSEALDLRTQEAGALSDRVRALEAEREQSRQRAEEAQRALRLEVEGLESRLDGFAHQLRAREAELAGVRDELEGARALARDQAETQAAALAGERQRSEEDRRRAEEERARSEEAIELLRQETDRIEGQLADARAGVASLERALRDAEARVAERELHIADLRTRVAGLEDTALYRLARPVRRLLDALQPGPDGGTR